MSRTLRSLHVLRKNLENELEDVVRQRTQIERERGEHVQTQERLMQSLEREQDVLNDMSTSEDAHALALSDQMLTHYTQTITQHLDALDQGIQLCDQRIYTCTERVQELFCEIKVYDTLIQKQEDAIRMKERKQEQAFLDEVALQKHSIKR